MFCCPDKWENDKAGEDEVTAEDIFPDLVTQQPTASTLPIAPPPQLEPAEHEEAATAAAETPIKATAPPAAVAEQCDAVDGDDER